MSSRSHRTHKPAAHRSKLARQRENALKLRARKKNDEMTMMERRQARMAWWHSAFRTPEVGYYNWVYARAVSMSAAILTLLGFNLSTRVQQRGSRTARQLGLRMAMVEGLEPRQLMAADVTAFDLNVASDTGTLGDRTTKLNSPQIDVAIAPATAVGGDVLELRSASNANISTTILGGGQTTASFIVPGGAFAEGNNTYRFFVNGVEDVAFGANNLVRDTIAPSVGITDDEPSVANIANGDVVYTFSFSESVSGFTAADVVVSGGTKGTFSTIDAKTYTLAVTPAASSTANITVDVPAGGAADVAGNDNSASAQAVQAVDTLAPTVTITDDEPAVANIAGGPVVFTFTFSEDVSGFTAGDIAVAGGTAGAFSTIDAKTYTLSVTPAANSTANITVDVAASVATDVNANPNVAAVQAVQAVDTLAPTVVITDDEPGVANIAGGAVVFTFTFSENVSGFTAGDIVVTGGTAGAFNTIDAKTYTLSVTPAANSTANITVDVAANVATDVNLNPNVAAVQAVQAVDTLAPTVVITDDEPGVANIAGGPVVFTFTFSENVSGFTAGDIAVAGGTAGAFNTIDAKTYTLSVTPAANSTANITVDVAASVANDVNANPNVAAVQAVQAVDTLAPTVVITDDEPGVANIPGGPVVFTFTFSENVTGFTAGDIVVTGGTAGAFSTIDAKTYTLSVTPAANSTANITVDVAANVATDVNLNPNVAAVQAVQAVDTLAPTVVITDDEPGVANIPGGPVVFTFTFSENVSGFTAGDIVVTGGTAGAFGTIDAKTYTLSVTPAANSTANITVDVAANVATDVNLNPNVAAVQAVQAVDTLAPTVVITDDEPGIANIAGGPVVFTFTFSENVSGFTAGDIVVSGGTAGAFNTIDAKTYTLSVTPAANSTANITVDVAANVATDVNANPNVAAVQAVQAVDTQAPSVTINQKAGQPDATTALPVEFTVTFSEPVTGFSAADVVLGGTATFVVPPTITVTGGPTVYNVAVTGTLATLGTLTASIPAAGAAQDLALNNSTPSTSTDNTVTIVGRTVTILATDSAPMENQINQAQYTVFIDTPSAQATVVTFALSGTADRGALPLGDFEFGPQVTPAGPNFTVTIPAGAGSTVIDIDLRDDLLFDPGETIVLTLLSATNVPAADAVIVNNGPVALRTMTIQDNEVGSILSATATAPNASEGSLALPVGINGVFTIALTTPLDSASTATFLVGGTAVGNGVDYSFTGANVVSHIGNVLTVSIPANTSSVLVTVDPVEENAIVELTESVTLTPQSIVQTNPVSAPVAMGSGGTVTITDDESATVAVEATSGLENGPNLAFVFTQTKVASTDTPVNFSTVNGPDLNYGIDYVLYSNVDSVIANVETNNTLATAQSLNGNLWNLAPNPNITDDNTPVFTNTSTTIPHVTISGTSDGTYNFYTFTVLENGSRVLIDIDNYTSFVNDPMLHLFDAAGNPIASDDDHGISDPGSGTSTFPGFDSFIDVVLNAGVYTVALAGTGSVAIPGGVVGPATSAGDTYTLHISAENVLSASPTSVIIPAGSTTAVVVNNPINENLLENNETVTLTISTLGPGHDVDITVDTVSDLASPTDHIASSTISDDDTATVTLLGTGSQFGLNTKGVRENALEPSTNGLFTVQITNPSDTAITVPFEIDPSSLGSTPGNGAKFAQYGVDYTFGAGVTGTGTKLDPFKVVIPASTAAAPITSVQIPIVVINESVIEQDEKIVLNLLDVPVVPITDPNRALVGPNGDNQVTLVTPSISQIPGPFVSETYLGGTGALSQYDTGIVTPPDLRNFATVYDNFVLPVTSSVGSVSWVGKYETSLVGLNPTFEISFYQDNGSNAPGLLINTYSVGTAGETAIAGFPKFFGYTAGVSPLMLNGGTTYWVSIVAQLPFGTDGWAMAFSAIGDDLSVQDFETTPGNLVRFTDPVDYAVAIGTKASDSILIKDEDLGAVLVNSSIDNAVEGGTNGEFKFTLGRASTAATADLPVVPVTSSQDVTITYTITGDTGDITAPALTGSVTIPAGFSSTTLSVVALNDLLNEPIENVVLTINTITSGDSDIAIDTKANNDKVFIIDNDDTTVRVITSDSVASEPADNGEFRLELVGAKLDPAANVVVTYQLTGTATLGPLPNGDYTGPTLTATILAGQTSTVIPILVNNDSTVEGPETVQIKILSVTPAPGSGNVAIDAQDTASLTIQDNDTATVTVTASDPTAKEGADDGEFTITLSNPSSTGVLVFYSLTSPTVIGSLSPADLTGKDFTLIDEYNNTLTQPTGSVFVPPNTTSVKIKLDVIDDASFESLTERVTMQLTGYGSPLFSSGSPSTNSVDILRDQLVTVTGKSNAVEGNSAGSFTISIDEPSTVPVLVAYTLTGVTAPGDYASVSGVATIPANATSTVVTIDPTVTGNDSIPEPIETVTITLNGINNAPPNVGSDVKLGTKVSETLTIADDDAAYVTVAATNRAEGDVGSGNVMFTFTLRDIDGNPINATDPLVVNYSLTGSAINGTDYTPVSSSTRTIPIGSSSTTVTVSIANDLLLEGVEDVTLTMNSVAFTSPSLAGKAFRSAIGGPTLVFQEGFAHVPGYGAYTGTQDTYIDPELPFSNLDTAGLFANLDTPSPGINPQQALLRFENLFGSGAGRVPTGANITGASLDLTAVTGGNVNLFNMLASWNESLNWASSNSLGDGLLGITPGTADASGAAVSGTTNFSVLAALQAWQANPATNFGWTVQGNDTLPDLSVTNFRDSEFGTVAQRPKLTVTLSTSATATITDNDGGQIKIVSATSPAEETTNGVVTVQLPNAVPAGHSVTVNYSVGGGGTATAGSDYTAVTTTLNIAAGATTGTFLIPVLGDNLIEGNETVQIKLNSFSVSGANAAAITAITTIDTAPQLVNIIDDDSTTATVSVLTPGSELPSLPLGTHTDPVFRVSIGKTSTQPTELNFTLTGTTVSGADYAAPGSTKVIIPAGSLFTDVTVNLTDDIVNESDETIIFTLVNPVVGTGVTIDPVNFTVTEVIEDDDQLTAKIVATDATAKENPTSDTGLYTISLTPSDKSTVVPFTIDLPGTASDPNVPFPFPVGGVPGPTGISGPDYALVGGATVHFTSYTTGTVTFPASATAQTATISLTAVQDYLTEPTETAIISLGTPVNVNVTTPLLPPIVDPLATSATVNIVDEEFSVKIEKTASFGVEDGPPISGFNGQYTVTISNPTLPGDDVTVPFKVVNGGAGKATYGDDYTLTGIGVFVDAPGLWPPGFVTGKVVIAGGTTTRLITVDVAEDALVEGNEDIDIEILTPTDVNAFPLNATISTLGSPTKATETIIDNDAPTLTISVIDDLDGILGGDAPGIAEPNNNTKAQNNGAFRFTLDQKLAAVPTVITYQIEVASTAETTDYNNVIYTGTVTIPANTFTTDIMIIPTDDQLVEGNEKLTLKILTATATPFPITIGTGTATAEIIDNDSATVSISAIDADAREPSNPGIFEVTLSNPSETDTTVTYKVSGDARPGVGPGLFTSSDPFDYETLTGTVVIKANQLTAQVVVNTFEDDIVEDNETVIATLDAATDNVLITAAGSSIVNIVADIPNSQDTTVVTLTKSQDATEGGANGIFAVTLSKAADSDLTFDITATPGTAVGADYTAPTKVTVPKGSLGTTFSIAAVNDVIAEGTESFTVSLSNPVATPAFVTPTASALVLGLPTTGVSMSILDNDTATLQITSQTINEGNVGGTNKIRYTVTSPIATPAGYSVAFSFTGGTATGPGAAQPNDFNYTGSTILNLGALAGSTTTFEITLNGDTLVEANETVEVTLGALSGATPAVLGQLTSGAKVDGVITNDDKATFKVSDAVVTEGGNLTFNITIDSPNQVDIAVPLTIDFTDGSATGLPYPLLGPIPYGTDYDKTTVSVLFPANSSGTTSFTVATNPDAIVEGLQQGTGDTPPAGVGTPRGFETLTAKMTTTSIRNVDVSDQGTGQINDDDSAVVSVSSAVLDGGDPLASEPVAAQGTGKFVFKLDNDVQAPVTINYSYTVDGKAGDANGDLTGLTGTTLPSGTGSITIPGSIAGSNKSVTAVLSVLDDLLLEDNEDVVLTITSISTDPSVTKSSTPATITILDDDTTTISIEATDDVAQEPDTAPNAGDATYKVFLSQMSDTPTTVNLTIVGKDTTASPGDYTGLPLTVTIPANSLSTTFTIKAVEDFVAEPDEFLTVALQNPISGNPNITITTDPNFQSDKITIKDDGDGITVSVSKKRDGAEPGLLADDEGQFVVELKDALGNPAIVPFGSTTAGLGIKVIYLVSGGTANNPGDYNAPTGILTIAEGQSSGLISIDVTDDAIVEALETVQITATGIEDAGGPITKLPGPQHLNETIALGSSVANLSIQDNDTANFTINSINVSEGAGTAVLTISLDKALDIATTVDINFTDGTATGGGVDYGSGKQSVIFGALDKAPKIINVPITNDLLAEGNEAFLNALSSLTAFGGRSVTFGTGAVVILDDDAVPAPLQIQEVRVGSSTWLPTFNNLIDPAGPVGQQGYAMPTGAAQDDTLPWVSIDRIYVKFTEDLNPLTVNGANIALIGVNGTPAVDVANLLYNASTNILTIPLLGTIKNDRLRLSISDAVVSAAGATLDGEWNNDVQSFNSGNGTAGGAFQFRFNVLPGDASHSTLTGLAAVPAPATDASDLATVFSSNLTVTTLGTIFKDINGSGQIDASDLAAVFPRLFTTLPGSLPGFLAFGGASNGLNSGLGSALTTPSVENEELTPIAPASSVATASSSSNNYSRGVDLVLGGLDASGKKDDQGLTSDALDEVFGNSFDDLLP